jgi:hypothetical protein
MLTTFVLTLILTASPANAGWDFREAVLYDGHVTLEIPADWEEIPPELLETHSLQMAEATGGLLTEIYQHGFRAEDPEIDFALPECLIQIRESGRLSYRQFLRLPSVEQMRAAGEQTLAEHARAAVRGLELSDAFFDRDSFSLHLSNTLELSYEGETSVRSFAFLTERGLFTIHFYARAAQSETMDPVYVRIIDSVRFDDELKYQPRLTDYWPPPPPMILLTAAALIAVGAIALHLLQRRRGQS